MRVALAIAVASQQQQHSDGVYTNVGFKAHRITQTPNAFISKC